MPMRRRTEEERHGHAEEAQDYREEIEQAEGACRHDHARSQPVGDPDDPVGIQEDHEQECARGEHHGLKRNPVIPCGSLHFHDLRDGSQEHTFHGRVNR